MKKMPLGMQCFREIIKGDYVYVDKTEYVYKLVNDANYYFLSRPRRFGKSLLLDTIAEAFGGDKELFKGLFIYDSDYSFESHPVIRLDMSGVTTINPDDLTRSIAYDLKRKISKEKFNIDGDMPSYLFKSLIEASYEKYNKKVVVLIDEYDKPILDKLGNLELAEANREVVRNLYGVLKSMDQYLRFTFITGVSKFTKTSLFSGLNNLYDITLASEYANICGITVEDFDTYFDEYTCGLETLDYFKRYDNVRDEILRWYDGYSWDGETRVLNPFSLLNFYMRKQFSCFWYSSGSPKFLIDMLNKKPVVYTNINKMILSEYMLDSTEYDKIEAVSLLFQTGYMTIKEVVHTPGVDEYLLGIPNFEVGYAFNMHMLSSFSDKSQASVNAAQTMLDKCLRDGDLQGLLDTMKGIFASIPYELHLNREAYYHSIFFAIMNVLGYRMDAEVSVSGGRVDAVLELNDKVYVMEFKYVDCACDADSPARSAAAEDALSEAMEQIITRGYADRYAGSGKAVYRVAMAFVSRDGICMRYSRA